MAESMLLLWIMIIVFIVNTSAVSGGSSPDFLIWCGLPRSSVNVTSLDGRQWRSDEDSIFSPPNITAKAAYTSDDGGDGVPYAMARIFNSTLKYSFPISPVPKFLRLYFASKTSYNNIPPSQFSLSLEANNFTVLHNFSPYLNSQTQTPSCLPPPTSQPSNFISDFHLLLDKSSDHTLNLTFSPGNSCSRGTSCLGFINGIEIVSAPDGLYINYTTTQYLYVGRGYDNLMPNELALQTICRLNVGGSTVEAAKDAGNMGRTWYQDDGCIAGGFYGNTVYPPFGEGLSGITFSKIPDYTAPKTVYGTQRFIGLVDSKERETANLKWRFTVDTGFDYLVRLHFCEMDNRVTRVGQRTFFVYVNGEIVSEKYVDVWSMGTG